MLSSYSTVFWLSLYILCLAVGLSLFLDSIQSIFFIFICLSACISVRLHPKNVKTAEPIGPKFFVGHLGTPGKVYK